MNRQMIYRTLTAGKVPTVSELLDGELALNIPDQKLFLRMGDTVKQLNHVDSIETTSDKQFVSAADKEAWNTTYQLPVADATTLGGVKVAPAGYWTLGGDGSVTLNKADATHAGYLAAADFAAFAGKQDALGFTPVNVAGDTMEGSLILAADPTAALEATTKQYTDNALSQKLDLDGGTMTGLLVLSGDPEQGLGAATKQYVDTLVDQLSGEYAAPLDTLVQLSALVSTGIPDKQMRLVEATGAIFRFDVQSTDVADGVGVIKPDDNPTAGRWIKVQGATQSHNALKGLQGGATGDYLHLTTAEKNAYDAHIIDTDVHVTQAQSTLLDSISASATEINYLSGVTSSIQDQLDGKQASLGYTAVNRAGDTMEGDLVLANDPTAPMHAVTLQYLQAYVIDAGTF